MNPDDADGPATLAPPMGSQSGEPVSLVRARQSYNEGLDWDLIAVLRKQASARLSEATRDGGGHLSKEEQRERGRAIILELLNDESSAQVTAGQDSWSLSVQEQMAKALDDALFGMGRLQPLLDDDRVENILIAGHARVWLELAGGRLIKGPPVASSDQELIDFRPEHRGLIAGHRHVDTGAVAGAQPRPSLRAPRRGACQCRKTRQMLCD